MPAPANARLLMSVNGGASQTGGVNVSYGDTVQLTGESTDGWDHQRWEIFYFPLGFATPSGWSVDADGTIFSTALTPSIIQLPANVLWGKWLFRLRINDALTNDKADGRFTDKLSGVRIPSDHGLQDLGGLEDGQFGGSRLAWTKDHQANLRIIDTGLGGGGGGAPTGAAGGDLGGNYPNPNVLKIHGATVPAASGLTVGNLLQVSGASALIYAALNLAGGANFVTGNLPIGNIAPGTSGQVFVTAAGPVTAWATPAGDWTGAVSANVVGKIKGTTVTTAGGALLTGQPLRTTAGAVADWGPLDLANPNAVTGTLPTGNLPSLAGDVTGPYAANTVVNLTGTASVITSSANTLTFTTTAIGGIRIKHTDQTANSTTGKNFTLQAQNSTGLTSTGGSLVLTSGTGTSGAGTVLVEVGGSITATYNADGTINFNNYGTGIIHSNGVGLLSSSLLVNADVSAGAAIAVSKIAPGTSGQVLVTNASPTTVWVTAGGDWLGPVGTNTVIGLTGTTGTVAMHGTSILWDASGPSLETSSGALILKTNGTNKNIQLVASAGTIGTFSRAGSQSAFLTPSNVDLLIQGVGTGAIQLLAGGDLRLDSDNIYFRSSASANKGRWTSAGLRVGDGNAAVQAIEAVGTARLTSLVAGVVMSDSTGVLSNTGTIPVGNLPNLVGDVTGAVTANTVISLTGTANVVAMHGITIQWDETVASPALLHKARTTDAATTDFTITSQGPVAGATTNKNPGNLLYKVPAAAAGGTEGKHSFFVAGTERVRIGSDGSAAAFISIGSNVATIGAARFSNNTGFYGRNFNNNADILLLQLNTSDSLNFGDTVNAVGCNFNAKSGGNGVQVIVGANTMALFNSTVRFPQLGTGVGHLDSVGTLTSSLLVNADVSSSAAIAVSKIAAGTSGQILVSDATPATVWATSAGDWTGAVTANTVIGLTGTTNVVAMHGTTILWDAAKLSATIKQADLVTNSGIGADLTLQAQNATGTTATGGNFIAGSGTGTSGAGGVLLKLGSAAVITLSVVSAGVNKALVNTRDFVFDPGIFGGSLGQQEDPSGNASDFLAYAQDAFQTSGNSNGGHFIVRGGKNKGVGLNGGVELKLGLGAGDIMLQVKEVATSIRLVGICTSTALSTSNLSTGSNVAFWGDCSGLPSTDPTGGVGVFSFASRLHNRGGAPAVGSGGAITAVGFS